VKRILAMGSIKGGVRSLLIVRHGKDGRVCTTLRVDKLPTRPRAIDLDLPAFLTRREVSSR